MTAARTSGLRAALTRGIRDHAERAGQGKRAANVTQDDVMIGAGAMLSVFIREPEFQGQTKDRLATSRRSASPSRRSRTMSITGSPAIPTGEQAARLGGGARRRAAARRAEKETQRKSATRKLRLPGKLADCTNTAAQGLRAVHRRGRLGGRLGQAGARPREPGGAAAARQDPQRRSAGKDKLAGNQQLADLVQALGCGTTCITATTTCATTR
jgi:topoisomerase-4 subunit B